MDRVDIEPLSLGERGRRYQVLYARTVLIESSRNPEFDACRALVAKGITGLLEVWHRGVSFAAVRLDIEKGANLTVEEGDHLGPRFARWQPRPEGAAEAAEDVVSRSSRSPKTATNENPGRGPLLKSQPVLEPALTVFSA